MAPELFARSALVTSGPTATTSVGREMRYVSERREQQTRPSRVEHQTANPPDGLRPARKSPRGSRTRTRVSSRLAAVPQATRRTDVTRVTTSVESQQTAGHPAGPVFGNDA